MPWLIWVLDLEVGDVMVDGSLRRMRLRPLVLRRIAARERESRKQGELAGRVVAIWDRWALAEMDRLVCG
jgi:hypothetical protein